jgi:hypothetical protein
MPHKTTDFQIIKDLKKFIANFTHKTEADWSKQDGSKA